MHEADKYLPPEARAARRALQLRTESEHQPDLVLLRGKYIFFQYLPTLDGGSWDEGWVPRYKPETGELYITRWHDPTRTRTSAEGRRIRFVPTTQASRDVALRKPAWVRGAVDLTNIPMSWNVQAIVPQKHWDIESALRQQDEVHHDYVTGPEFARSSEITTIISTLTTKYLSGSVTDENFPQLRKEVNEVLDSNGLKRPNDENLRLIAEKLTRASARDSLGRINRGRARYILASAYVTAAMREVALFHSAEKAAKVYSTLLTERKIERVNLESAKKMLDRLIGRDPRIPRDRIFDYQTPRKIMDSEVTRFRIEQLSEVVAALRSVRVNPYFLVARMSDLLVAGNDLRSTKDFKLIKGLMEVSGMSGLTEFVGENGSVDLLIRQRKTGLAASMIRRVSGLIDSCLRDKSLGDIKVF